MNFKPMFLSFLFSTRRRKRGSGIISWIFFLERGRESEIASKLTVFSPAPALIVGHQLTDTCTASAFSLQVLRPTHKANSAIRQFLSSPFSLQSPLLLLLRPSLISLISATSTLRSSAHHSPLLPYFYFCVLL